MRPLCFQWHPDARAYAGDTEVARVAASRPSAVIPTHPTAETLAQLGATLRHETAFCISDDRPLPDITGLARTQFATLTGGTSGPPKVIARSQKSWIDSFYANAARFGYTPQDNLAVLGNLGHSLALYGGLEGLHLGLGVHVLASIRPTRQSALLARHRCSILYATPTQLRLLPAERILPDVRLILCGGGALDPASRHHITAICPNATLHVFYGAAETSFVTLGDANSPQGSVGQPYTNVEIEIRNPDVDGVGSVWVKSPFLFDRYLQGDSPHTVRDAEWVTVGEQGYRDKQGNLFLRGRAGRSVNIADQTVHLDELQSQLAEVPGITACVLLVRADQKRGHHVVAVIEGPERQQTVADIKSHCAQQQLHCPRRIVFLERFPLLASGKPDLQCIAAQTGLTA